jgi:hypothetical protein
VNPNTAKQKFLGKQASIAIQTTSPFVALLDVTNKQGFDNMNSLISQAHTLIKQELYWGYYGLRNKS